MTTDKQFLNISRQLNISSSKFKNRLWRTATVALLHCQLPKIFMLMTTDKQNLKISRQLKIFSC